MAQDFTDNKSTLVQVMVPDRTKPLPEPMLTLIYVTGPQPIKSEWA